jgi:hypothetical protein
MEEASAVPPFSGFSDGKSGLGSEMRRRKRTALFLLLM